MDAAEAEVGGSKREQQTDAQLADAAGLLKELKSFVLALEAWTIPTEPPERPGRRLHLPAGGAALTAHSKALNDRFWQSREGLIQDHRWGHEQDPQHFGLGTFTFQVGWGGIDYTLYNAIEEVRDLLSTPTVRAVEERAASRRGVPKSPGFDLEDVIPNETIERFRSASKLLQQVIESDRPFDPFAILAPGSRGPRCEAAQVSSKRPPELSAPTIVAPAVRTPRDLVEAKTWLITRTRLAKYLKLGKPKWLAEEWINHKPVPAWSAPPGSGMHTQFRLGELYDSFRRSSGKTLKSLQPECALYALLVPPEHGAEMDRIAVPRKSGSKRSKAHSQRTKRF